MPIWLPKACRDSWGRSSIGRAPALQAGGCRFDAGRFHQFKQRIPQTFAHGCVAERLIARGCNPRLLRKVIGSNPIAPTNIKTPCSAAGSALALGARGRQFEPGHGDQDHALLTQLVRVLPCLGRSQRFESAAGRQTFRNSVFG